MKISWKSLASVGCIAAIIVVWLGMAELVKDVQILYPKPYFLAFIARCIYSSCFLLWGVWRAVPKRTHPLGYFNWCYFFGASIPLALAAFLSGWFWYLSLPRTSVSGNTAIYQSNSMMVFAFSVVLLKETVTLLKMASLGTCLSGVLLVSYFGTPKAHSASENVTAGGYILCFLSMVLFALYEVLYKKWASHSADTVPIANATRFMGLLGLSTMAFCGPALLIMDIMGYEVFELPEAGLGTRILLLGLLDTLFNLFILFLIMLSSPLFASIGCLLVLPASLLWDFVAHHYRLPFGGLLGVVLICVGFGGFLKEELSVDSEKPRYEYEVVSSDNMQSDTAKTIWHHGVEMEHAVEEI